MRHGPAPASAVEVHAVCAVHPLGLLNHLAAGRAQLANLRSGPQFCRRRPSRHAEYGVEKCEKGSGQSGRVTWKPMTSLSAKNGKMPTERFGHKYQEWLEVNQSLQGSHACYSRNSVCNHYASYRIPGTLIGESLQHHLRHGESTFCGFAYLQLLTRARNSFGDVDCTTAVRLQAPDRRRGRGKGALD